VVKDDAETWEVQSPNLRGSDAKWDMMSVRHMIDAVGFPPHWRGEGGDANLATATAMQVRPERHLRRRQNYLVFILQDLIYQAFIRAAEVNKAWGAVPRTPFHRLFNTSVSDISTTDNIPLASAAQQLSQALANLFDILPPQKSPTFTRLVLRLILKFAGEPQDDQTLNDILNESGLSTGDGLAGDRSAEEPG
jgi:hypothetical protein